MCDMADNLWLDGADRAYAQLYVLDDTPWDYKTQDRGTVLLSG